MSNVRVGRDFQGGRDQEIQLPGFRALEHSR